MERKERILIFSDAHFFRGADLKEKQGPLTLKERIALKIVLSLWPDRESLCQEYFQKMLDRVSELEPFSCLLDLGDATFGSNNQGLVTEQACRERETYNQMIEDNFPEVSKKFLWGNHDVGFRSRLSRIFDPDYQKEGLNKKSFLKSKDLIGPPWDTFEVGCFTFLLLNSEIIQASNQEDSHDRSFFIKRAREQEKFIEDTLKNSSNQIILAIHDPSPLRCVWFLLKPYHQRICLTLAGHHHTSFSGKLLQASSSIYRTLNLKIIPSPWPCAEKISKEGGGFATLELSDNSPQLEYHWL